MPKFHAPVEIKDLTSTSSTKLIGSTNDGLLANITVGSGLSLSGGTLSTTGGGVSGSGTTGTIPVWSGATALGDSPLTVTGTDVTVGGTGFFRPPVGTTAQQPGTPSAGMLRYNSTNGAMQYYGAAAWEVPLKSATATGLGTAGRVFYADANGRAASATKLEVDEATDGVVVKTNTSNGYKGIAHFHNVTNAGGANYIVNRSRGTFASPTALAENDFGFLFSFRGRHSSAYAVDNAVFGTKVSGAVSGTTIPVSWFFAAGTAASSYNMGILLHHTGKVGINAGLATSSIVEPSAALHVNGSISRNAPVTKTGNFTVADTENWLIVNNASANTTVTLPTASSWTGREIMLKNLSGTYTVISNASNVVPIDGTSAGTAILPATAGAWCTLVSDGTNWVIMQQ